MPRKAPTPCRHRGCPCVVDVPGYCADHAQDAVGWRKDRERGSRHRRGYGAAWIRIRARVLARDNGLCLPCLRAGRIAPARHVDHIRNKREGGTDDESNLQSICIDCHKAKTARESGRRRT
ncbi:MAG: HNH endonuclease [Janthinobacterium lividum]